MLVVDDEHTFLMSEHPAFMIMDMHVDTYHRSVIISLYVHVKALKQTSKEGNKTTNDFFSSKDEDGSEQNNKTAFKTIHRHGNDADSP